MFKLDPAPTFACTVQISAPGASSLPLKLHFKHQRTSALQQFMDTAIGRPDAEILADMVASIDPGEKPADQTDADFLLQLLDAYPAAKVDLWNAYIRALTESRVKN